MEIFFVEQTNKTPFIQFNGVTGAFDMRGKSIPENAKVFYLQLFEWMEKYIDKPAPITTFDVQLDYFNTTSAKCIIDIFKKLETIIKNSKGQVIINWHYNEDDGDMEEAGVDYQSIVKIPFNLISFIQ